MKTRIIIIVGAVLATLNLAGQEWIGSNSHWTRLW